MIRSLTIASLALLLFASATSPASAAPTTLQTEYARFQIDDRGFITSLQGRQNAVEYCPPEHPSPLLSLHEGGQPYANLVAPRAATFSADKQRLELQYPNGAKAVVKVAEQDGYVRLQLVSLEPRGSVDNIVWGPLHTNISKLIGDLIGVVRNDDWAIGMYGLEDNTIAGPPVDGDCYQMGYYIHSTDPEKHPVPPQYKEGQWFPVGGDGVNDVAFFSRPEEYFQYVGGNGAKLAPEFGSTIAYHARDRRKSYVHFFSLLPGFERSRPRHQVSDPIPGVDFIGSSVAIYACPDDRALKVLEKMFVTEGLPYYTINGRWIRDPANSGVTLNWNGPRDKCIEYALALGVKDISRETAEFYPSRGDNWNAGLVWFTQRLPMSFQEFSAEANRHGLTHGGLHTLCVFLQGGRSRDVSPVPSQHLQSVCRTTLAGDISPDDTAIVVTDPSYLAEKGTWTWGDDSNYLQIGDEMLRYEGISESAPWTLSGVKRGHASQALPHKAGDEVRKLQQNCYNGFVPDMTLLLEYADYYADLMVRNGMDAINFDGFESTVYQNHGYYGVRVFCRRLFESYGKLTGGKVPRVTTSNVFAGSWEYLYACNVGGGANMFNPLTGQRAIEGKDIGNAFGNSYFPTTFGIQNWNSEWSRYDAGNLQAKAIGWEATYALSVSQEEIDRTGERDAIFKAFPVWQKAREAQLFTKAQKALLRDPDYKFTLEPGDNATSFVLTQIKELRAAGDLGAAPMVIENPYGEQPLEFAIRLNGGADALVRGLTLTLPDGGQVKVAEAIPENSYLICKGDSVYLADAFRKPTADVQKLAKPAILPAGSSSFSLQIEGRAKFELTVYAVVKRERLGK